MGLPAVLTVDLTKKTMFKKLIALSGVLLSMAALPALAQQAAAPVAPSQTPVTMRGNRMQQYMAADPATRAKKMTDRLTQALSLDQATSQKVYDAALVRDQKIDAIQKGTDDNRTKAQALKANADDFKSKLQGILTPDQFAKFQSMRKHMQDGMGGPGNDKKRNDDN